MRCVICGTTDKLVIHLDVPESKNTDGNYMCTYHFKMKKQILLDEKKNNKIFSALNIPHMSMFGAIPWERYVYNDITATNSFWYDPVGFMDRYRMYSRYTVPVVAAIKRKNKNIRINGRRLFR